MPDRLARPDGHLVGAALVLATDLPGDRVRVGPGTYNAITAYARDEGVSLRTTASAYGVYDGLLY